MKWAGILYRFLILWILLGVVGMPSWAQPSERPEAWIIARQGPVFIKKQDSTTWHPYEALAALSVGDSVWTREGGTATLLYRKGEIIPLGEKERHGVEDARDTNAPPPVIETLDWAFDQPVPEDPGVERGDKEEPVLVFPKQGRVLCTTPPFGWIAGQPDGTAYRVRVVIDHSEIACRMIGDDLWEEEALTDTTFIYPHDAPPLDRGKRYWVDIGRANWHEFEDGGCFTVATNEEVEAFTSVWEDTWNYNKNNKANYPEVAFAEFATYLIKQGYYTDAFLYLRAAEEGQVDVQFTQWWRDVILEETGPTFLIQEALKFPARLDPSSPLCTR